MRNIPACIFCTTPFQIMAAICLMKDKKFKADLYILNQFKQADEVADRMQKEKIFEKVIAVDDSGIKQKYLSHRNYVEFRLKLATTYLHVKEIAESILIPDTHYDEMYVSSQAYVSRLVYFYIIKKKLDTKLVYFDDGEGSYDNDKAFIPKCSDRLIRLLMFGKKSCENVKTKYLYSPELYFRLHPQSAGEEVKKISCIWRDKEAKKLLERIFSLSDETKISEPVIFIDTLRSPLSVSMNETVDSALEILSAQFGKDRIIIKKHPRDFENMDDGYKYYLYNSIPFEAICTQMDMDKKVMVVVRSTAAVMPKILLNEEPYVIMLYKMIEGSEKDERGDLFFEACAEEYSRPDRFFMPTTLDEFKDILNKIRTEENIL